MFKAVRPGYQGTWRLNHSFTVKHGSLGFNGTLRLVAEGSMLR